MRRDPLTVRMQRIPRISAALLLLGLGAGLGPDAIAGDPVSQPVGVTVQDDAGMPLPWRTLDAAEQAQFDLGHAVFNSHWAPANTPAGRRDGLGPVFNGPSCDGCHNSRRRGRGPLAAGEAPIDLVIQLGTHLSDGSVQRGSPDYGFILNTAAIDGFEPEGWVRIQYEEQVHTFTDGSQVSVRMPHYEIGGLDKPLPPRTVLMPRMTPSVHGTGLLEQVPLSVLQSLATTPKARGVAGRVAWMETPQGRVAGRFGWQATEPSVAAQTAAALSREMGLTTALQPTDDCGHTQQACKAAPSGGVPEVEALLFDAVVFFQRLHGVPVTRAGDASHPGNRLFRQSGCADCHVPELPIDMPGAQSAHSVPLQSTPTASPLMIPAYTDLLLHDLGPGLADRDLQGAVVRSEWRTAPLWGIPASVASRQRLRLLHDGRARTIEEAILWHDGEAREARGRFMRLPAEARQSVISWIAGDAAGPLVSYDPSLDTSGEDPG